MKLAAETFELDQGSAVVLSPEMIEAARRLSAAKDRAVKRAKLAQQLQEKKQSSASGVAEQQDTNNESPFSSSSSTAQESLKEKLAGPTWFCKSLNFAFPAISVVRYAPSTSP